MSIPPAALPVGVEPLRVTTGRGEFAALRAGPDTGPMVVLVPGFTGSKEDFAPTMPLLADAGCCAVAYDQRGQFESPASLDGYSLDGFRDDLVAVLQDLGPAHIVGHSFGGQVARAATLARPELVASLTLMDSGPGPVPQQFCDQLAALRELIPVATLEQIWQVMEALDRENGVPQPPSDIHEFLHRRWLANDPRSVVAVAEALTTATDDTNVLADLTTRDRIPVLVMYGADDTSAWPITEQQDMARRLGVSAVAIPGAAHSPAVENPQDTAAQLVAFVTPTSV